MLKDSLSNLEFVLIGLRWDGSQYSKDFYFDIDISAFMLDETDKLINPSDFIFYNNLKDSNGAIVHSGDNRNGGNNGSDNDSETIAIDFSKIPEKIKKIAICVSIHDSEIRHSNFGQVSDAHVRIVQLAHENDKKGTSILLFDLSNEFSAESALIVAEFRRNNGKWDCSAVSRGVNGGLEGICRLFEADIDM